MGLILDSSVLVAAERQGYNARQMLASIARKIAETEVGISVVTLIELAHGAARADTPERKAKRQKFIEELLTAIPTHPVTVPLALRAGQIDGENQARGIRVPLPDLLIGVTALELDTVWGRPIFATSNSCPVCPSWNSSPRKTVQAFRPAYIQSPSLHSPHRGKMVSPFNKQTPSIHTIMVTHTNGSSRYIPDDAAFEQTSYEITTSHLKSGCAENAIVNGFLHLIEQR
jgi:tRNA(fMet)-specific endonuclease VapC